MAKCTLTIEECLKQAEKYTSMGFHAQAEVWKKQAEAVKKEYAEKRMKGWKRKMGLRLEGSSISITEWIEWAKSLYSIEDMGGMYTVTSRCSDGVWELEYEVDALEKVWQLIGYKEYDRKRGRGCVEEDLIKG